MDEPNLDETLRILCQLHAMPIPVIVYAEVGYRVGFLHPYG